MQIFYFTFPRRYGDVYTLQVPNGHTFNPATDIVRLNDGSKTYAVLTVEESNWVSSVTKVASAGFAPQGRIWDAQLVIRESDPYPIYRGDWTPLLPKINAAAAVNTVYAVLLPQNEYARLLAGGLDDLRCKLSPRAASLVELNESSNIDFNEDNSGYAALDLYRTGRCP